MKLPLLETFKLHVGKKLHRNPVQLSLYTKIQNQKTLTNTELGSFFSLMSSHHLCSPSLHITLLTKFWSEIILRRFFELPNQFQINVYI
jgi:hypothetical protein